MDLVKAESGGPLVHRSASKDKIAAGLGAAGMVMLLPWLYHPVLATGACVAAVILSWGTVLDAARRTPLAVAALAMGLAPLAWVGISLVGIVLGVVLKMLIVAAIVGGVIYAGRKLLNKSEDE